MRLHDGRFRHLLFIYAHLGTLERVDHLDIHIFVTYIIIYMFGILDNKIRSWGSDVLVPAARVGIGTSLFSPNAQVQIQQVDGSTASGMTLQGTDGKLYNLVYNGSGLAISESGSQKVVIANGGNVGRCCALACAFDPKPFARGRAGGAGG